MAEAGTPGALFPDLDLSKVEAAPRKRKTAAAKAAALAEGLPPNLGKPVPAKVPDFSDPHRPKTCLEVDFPLVPINALSALEGNAGKPIYQMSKWWARRRSCVFRALLLAAAMEAPTRKHPDGQPMLGPDGKPLVDEDAAAQLVWDSYYANHQRAGNFKHLKVLDPFMGGGTTLVEGSRLGFQVAGVDLNPVAWFIVKNELACTDPAEVKAFFNQIEAEVKPQIQPFYVTEGIGGKKGRWFKVDEAGDKAMPDGFDPVSLPPAQRQNYRYEGPEVIYTFWAKHGPCSKIGCGHRTPIFRSPIVATKKLGVKYLECTCKKCKTVFHAELGDARIAPDAEQVVLDNEHPYTIATPAFARRMMDYNEGSRDDKNKRIAELTQLVETEPGLNCPRCGSWSGQMVRDVLGMHSRATRVGEIDKKHLGILPKGVAKKPVYCTLLIDPEWLKGSPGEIDGVELGGYIDAPVEATEKWYRERLKNLRLIEVRGNVIEATAPEENETQSALGDVVIEEADDEGGEEKKPKSWIPETITLRDGRTIETTRGTGGRNSAGKPIKASFACGKCGVSADVLKSVVAMNARETLGQPQLANDCASCRAVAANHHPAPVACYLLQCYDAERDAAGYPYGGRYFKVPDEADIERLVAAEREWTNRKEADLSGFWPKAELPHVWTTHGWALPEHGYTHWYKMFNARQLLIHALLLSQCAPGRGFDEGVRLQAAGAVQQYLRNQNMLCIWNEQADKLEPFLSNPYMRPRNTTVESNLAAPLGRGNWLACSAGVVEGIADSLKPIDTVLGITDSKNAKVEIGDPVCPGAITRNHSSSELPPDWAGTIDLAITDPPFGENITYADMADFFYVWIRLVLKQDYAEQFGPPFVPQTLEAISNPFRHPGMVEDGPDAGLMTQADAFYLRMMTECWAETCRVLKPGGILAFTFHHDKDETWTLVLRSLFDAGFILEATYPVVSDESKGENAAFGSQKIEYDIIHVCRKRLHEPKPVSWPKMRQWVKAELARLRPLLESYKSRGLQDADVRVILRGKALEFYSRHYGKVLVSAPGGEDAVLSIRDALLGINQLLDESGSQVNERPPSIVQPVVYQYLRLFGMKAAYSRDEVSKLLRGTAIQQRDFEKTGSTPWIVEEDKVISRVPIYDRFQKMVKRSRRELKTELDQTHFLIGAAMPVREGETAVNIEKELERETFLVRPGVEALLDWYAKTPAGPDEPGVPKAAGLALTLLRAAFEAQRARMRQEQPRLFEEWEASQAVA